MSPRRGDRVAPPPTGAEWLVKFGTNAAAKGWEDLCSQAPANTRRAWQALLESPCPVPATTRHHRLKGALGTSQNGRHVWQYEVTGGGRIWYEVDSQTRTVYLIEASCGHPKATD